MWFLKNEIHCKFDQNHYMWKLRYYIKNGILWSFVANGSS